MREGPEYWRQEEEVEEEVEEEEEKGGRPSSNSLLSSVGRLTRKIARPEKVPSFSWAFSAGNIGRFVCTNLNSAHQLTGKWHWGH